MADDQKPAQSNDPDRSDVQNDDFARIGPLSIEGVEASDLPDKGRGPVETDPDHEAARNLPQNTGTISGEVGIRGTPDIADAAQHGGRKGN